MAAKALHARLVAQDAAAGQAAGGIDGQHGYPMAAFRGRAADKGQAEGLDERALARAGHAGNADAQGAAAVGQEAAQDFLGLLKVGRGVALDEGDGPGQYGTIAGQHAGDVLVNGERPPRPPGGVG